MNQDDVALALIQARLAWARDQQLATQIRNARREARRARRKDGRRTWWTRSQIPCPTVLRDAAIPQPSVALQNDAEVRSLPAGAERVTKTAVEPSAPRERIDA